MYRPPVFWPFGFFGSRASEPVSKASGVHLPKSVMNDLHDALLAAYPASLCESRRSRCNRYDIDILPLSGFWRITDRVTKEATEGESIVDSATRA